MLCQGPYASGRDWGAIEKALKEEGDEKKEGEAALNEMFQKIYADASDDVKRAMNKSFQESGGTVSHSLVVAMLSDHSRFCPQTGTRSGRRRRR